MAGRSERFLEEYPEVKNLLEKNDWSLVWGKFSRIPYIKTNKGPNYGLYTLRNIDTETGQIGKENSGVWSDYEVY